MKIYVASSWRNRERQQAVVSLLRDVGHRVYDFADSRTGFRWQDLSAGWKSWTPAQYLKGLEHPTAQAGFHSDMGALASCDACVLVLPCGRSAHLELGWAAGAGKRTYVLLDTRQATIDEPELMYLMNTAICPTAEDLVRRLGLAR